MFSGPPILPWFRQNASKPLKVQLAKARIIEGSTKEGAYQFPDLRLARLKLRGPAVRRKKKKQIKKSRR